MGLVLGFAAAIDCPDFRGSRVDLVPNRFLGNEIMTISLIALLLGAGGGALAAAKIAGRYYRRKAEKRLATVQAEFMRQMQKMQQIQKAEKQNIEAVGSAGSVEEISDAIDGIYRDFSD